jgi:hypothetical protein
MFATADAKALEPFEAQVPVYFLTGLLYQEASQGIYMYKRVCCQAPPLSMICCCVAFQSQGLPGIQRSLAAPPLCMICCCGAFQCQRLPGFFGQFGSITCACLAVQLPSWQPTAMVVAAATFLGQHCFLGGLAIL